MPLTNTTIGVLAGMSLRFNCIIWTPATYDKSRKYPLLIFGHGSGEAGTDINVLYNQGLPAALKAGYVPPFDLIICCPQAQSYGIHPEWLPEILKEMQASYSIDPARVALTGLSAGGLMCWGSQLNVSPALASSFAAIVILSGATQDALMTNIAWWKTSRVPVWAIVGAADTDYIAKNQKMVDAVNGQVPGLAKLSLHPGFGHSGWTEIYNGTFRENGATIWDFLKPLLAVISPPPVVVPPVVTPPRIVKDIHIEYTDGTSDTVTSITMVYTVGQTVTQL